MTALPKRLIHSQSKEAIEIRAKLRAELGIDRKYKVIPTVPKEYEGAAGDPQYYREVLGDTSNLDSFEL